MNKREGRFSVHKTSKETDFSPNPIWERFQYLVPTYLLQILPLVPERYTFYSLLGQCFKDLSHSFLLSESLITLLATGQGHAYTMLLPSFSKSLSLGVFALQLSGQQTSILVLSEEYSSKTKHWLFLLYQESILLNFGPKSSVNHNIY